ncbi:unnamed protein product [Echinostoma caproni]|uniref:CDP-diacylglycerol--inositol 3-phosphatidyltransferase n=1 Tax=Echinostoma caproni TaxID=27848 RepID=A0A183B0L8_9TREM|nr:unnamed protein product [Echinostoma caproni]
MVMDCAEYFIVYFLFSGYGRIILLLCSCYCMRTNCVAAAIAYIISGLLDALDGHAARILNQSTKFGAMLDMLVDRCATMCLLACLIVFYPTWMFVFQLSMIVDISSHWLHMHSSILGGGQSHKTIDMNASPILRLYYHNRIVLFLMCLGNEIQLLHENVTWIGDEIFAIQLPTLKTTISAVVYKTAIYMYILTSVSQSEHACSYSAIHSFVN